MGQLGSSCIYELDRLLAFIHGKRVYIINICNLFSKPASPAIVHVTLTMPPLIREASGGEAPFIQLSLAQLRAKTIALKTWPLNVTKAQGRHPIASQPPSSSWSSSPSFGRCAPARARSSMCACVDASKAGKQQLVCVQFLIAFPRNNNPIENIESGGNAFGKRRSSSPLIPWELRFLLEHMIRRCVLRDFSIPYQLVQQEQLTRRTTCICTCHKRKCMGSSSRHKRKNKMVVLLMVLTMLYINDEITVHKTPPPPKILFVLK